MGKVVLFCLSAELTKDKQADGTLWRAKHTVKAHKTICPGVGLAWHPLEQQFGAEDRKIKV